MISVVEVSKFEGYKFFESVLQTDSSFEKSIKYRIKYRSIKWKEGSDILREKKSKKSIENA